MQKEKAICFSKQKPYLDVSLLIQEGKKRSTDSTVFHRFILKTLILLTACEISNDMTHGSGSIDLIPAAEDEAGLSIIHPEEQQSK